MLINVGKTLKTLVASNLAYSLMSELSRDIGLKLAGLSGIFPGFGRVTTLARNTSIVHSLCKGRTYVESQSGIEGAVVFVGEPVWPRGFAEWQGLDY